MPGTAPPDASHRATLEQAEALVGADGTFSLALLCTERPGQVTSGQETQAERTFILHANPAIEWQQHIALHRVGAAWSCALGVAWHLQAGQHWQVGWLCRSRSLQYSSSLQR